MNEETLDEARFMTNGDTDTDTDTDEGICPMCAGSGEGQVDGTTCPTCCGRGVA